MTWAEVVTFGLEIWSQATVEEAARRERRGGDSEIVVDGTDRSLTADGSLGPEESCGP